MIANAACSTMILLDFLGLSVHHVLLDVNLMRRDPELRHFCYHPSLRTLSLP